MSAEPTTLEAMKRQLRALAALEDELDKLFAKKVSYASQNFKVSWDAIAEATGVTKQAAWRRWKPLVDDPSALRPRRDSDRVKSAMTNKETGEVTEGDKEAIHEMTRQLSDGLTKGHDPRPWSSGVRRVLEDRKLEYTARQMSNSETHFTLFGMTLFLAAIEQVDGQDGGVYATLAPAAQEGLHQGLQPRMERVSFPIKTLWPKEEIERAASSLLAGLLGDT